MKKLSKTALIGILSLAVVAGTVGVASAASPSNGIFGGRGFGMHIFAGDKIGAAGLRGTMGFDMNTVASALGMQLSDLTTALKSGQSINDIAASKNIDTTQLTQTLQSAAESKIDQAVTAGKLTSDQATALKAKIPTMVQNFLSRKGTDAFGKADGAGFRGLMGFDMNTVASALGMQLSDLTTALKSGQSINDIAASKNIDTTQLAQTLQSAAESKIDQAVTAGKLTSDQATALKAKLPTQVQNFLSRKRNEKTASGKTPGIGFRGAMGSDMNTVASALGMQLSDLTTALKSGQSINDIAASKNIDTTQLAQTLQSAAESKIDQAVTAGKLTSDQATALKAKLPTVIQNFLSRKWTDKTEG